MLLKEQIIKEKNQNILKNETIQNKDIEIQ